MTKDARIAAALLIPVVVGALFSLVRFALEGSDVPRDEDYDAALAVIVEQGYDRGLDAVAVMPPWSLRASQHLRTLSLISADLLHERPLHRYRRLFLVVEPDAGRWLRPLLDTLGAPSQEQDAGRVDVLTFELAGPRVTYDFRERLFDAVVEIGDVSGAPEPKALCDRRSDRGWSCPSRPSWQRVTRQHLLVSENGDDALWVHPPPRGEELILSYANVELGDVLVLRAGHTREGVDRAKAPVVVRVLVADQEVARVERDVRFHFRTDVIDTSRFHGQRADVAFRIHTENNGSNHFAIDAYAARGAPRDVEGGAP